jgi:threonylcarbamoyladenosine tRNA methylthiotransferase MtaB
MPLIGLGTDIVTGFPGESDTAFENTRSLLEFYQFGNLHVFPFSERPGTRAASMSNVVDQRTRRRRASALILLGETMRQAFACRHVGKPVTVLVERRAGDGSATGWTGEYLEAVISKTPAAPNQIVTLTAYRAEQGRLHDE